MPEHAASSATVGRSQLLASLIRSPPVLELNAGALLELTLAGRVSRGPEQHRHGKVRKGVRRSRSESLTRLRHGHRGSIEEIVELVRGFRVMIARQLDQRIFPDLFPERRQLALPQQAAVQAGRNGNDQAAAMTSTERTQVSGVLSRRTQRYVVAAPKQFFVLAAELEDLPGQVQLAPSVADMVDKLANHGCVGL